MVIQSAIFGELRKLRQTKASTFQKKLPWTYYASQREAIMRLSRNEAIEQLIEMHKIDSRIETIRAVSDNLIMNIA